MRKRSCADSAAAVPPPKLFFPIDRGDQRMISPTPMARAQLRLRLALWAAVVMLFYAPAAVDAQGLVQGVQQGANAGNKAAGPAGGVFGGAIGGVVGVFTVVLVVGKYEHTHPASVPK